MKTKTKKISNKKGRNIFSLALVTTMAIGLFANVTPVFAETKTNTEIVQQNGKTYVYDTYKETFNSTMVSDYLSQPTNVLPTTYQINQNGYSGTIPQVSSMFRTIEVAPTQQTVQYSEITDTYYPNQNNIPIKNNVPFTVTNPSTGERTVVYASPQNVQINIVETITQTQTNYGYFNWMTNYSDYSYFNSYGQMGRLTDYKPLKPVSIYTDGTWQPNSSTRIVDAVWNSSIQYGTFISENGIMNRYQRNVKAIYQTSVPMYRYQIIYTATIPVYTQPKYQQVANYNGDLTKKILVDAYTTTQQTANYEGIISKDETTGKFFITDKISGSKIEITTTEFDINTLVGKTVKISGYFTIKTHDNGLIEKSALNIQEYII